MGLPSNTTNIFVPNDLIYPDDPEEVSLILTDYFKQVVDSLNSKEVAQYSDIELATGQRWYVPGDANAYRFGNRKVIDIGALPNTAAKSVAHGLTVTDNTTFTHIYGVANNTSSGSYSYLPLPFVDPAALANGIRLEVDATNVIITTAVDYSAYDTCYIVLEYYENR